ncbi:HAMP domain-containing protein [bacterium SCSIO 12827]|nr:HAMP domain-containing protein [bacterium SCSIO 12827]
MTTQGSTTVPPRQGVRLRFVLAVVLIVVGSVPSVILASWLHARAIDIQVDDVSQRSLLLAKTLARFIAGDLNEFQYTLDALTTQYPLSALPKALIDSANHRGMSAVCLLSGLRQPQDYVVISGTASCLPRDENRMWRDVRSRLPATGGGVVFSEVLADSDGQPAVFAVNFRAGLPLAAARMSLDRLRELRRSIVFGEKGHVAIVDHRGNIVSHPRPDWEAAVKNIATIDPVARMMKGESGVSRFHSPAANLKMIAGFASVPGAGWGVMVPQPEQELAFHAEDIQKSTQIALIVGVLVAGGLAWWLAGWLTAPIARIEAASRRLAADEPPGSVDAEGFLVPAEVASLAANFTTMADRMQTRDRERERIVDDVRQLKNELEQRVADRTLELTMEINERDRAEKELLRSKAEVEYANRAKTEFLAHMSHELRTPLNAILGFAEVVRDTDPALAKPDQTRQYVQYIYDSGSHLLTLINDLLDISRIEVGAMALEVQTVDLREAVESCVTIVSERASKTGLKLVSELPDAPGTIEADPTRLRQILLNLMINAVKFTPKGGTVSLQLRRMSDGAAEFVISDTGIGIAPEDMSRIMEPFSQARHSHVSKSEGTGLGLPLAKAFAELHGGSLRVESRLGKGTTVRVILPVAPPPQEDVANILN